jgi:hypothetical protein
MRLVTITSAMALKVLTSLITDELKNLSSCKFEITVTKLRCHLWTAPHK